MRKRIFTFQLIFFAYCCLQSAKAQNGFSFTHDFCTDTAIRSVAFSTFADSSRFFLFGNTTTDSAGFEHAYLASFDYQQNLLWSKKILFPGKNGISAPYCIIKTGVDRYVTIGTIIDDTINSKISTLHPYFYIFNSVGDSIHYSSYKDTIVSKYYGSILYHNNHLVTAGTISSAGLHPVGSTYSYDSNAIWICKYDLLGNIIWQKDIFYQENGIPTAYKIILSADSLHYLIAARMWDPINFRPASYLIKIDTAGNVIWKKALPKAFLSWQEVDIVADADSDYYFVSSYSKTAPVGGYPSYSYIYYGKLNENGDTVWTRTYQGDLNHSMGLGIQWTPNKKNLILFSGPYSGAGAGAMKIDTSGNITWARYYQHYYDSSQQANHSLYSLTVTPDDRYLMVGYTDTVSNNHLTYNGRLSWIMLTDSSGCRYPNDPACMPVSVKEIAGTKQELKIYPNPVYDKLTIEGVQNNSMMQIFDIVGREVYKGIVQHEQEKVDVRMLPRGNYILQIRTEAGERISRKIFKD